MRLDGYNGSEGMGLRSDQCLSDWIVGRLSHVLALRKPYLSALPARWDNASRNSVSGPLNAWMKTKVFWSIHQEVSAPHTMEIPKIPYNLENIENKKTNNNLPLTTKRHI